MKKELYERSKTHFTGNLYCIDDLINSVQIRVVDVLNYVWEININTDGGVFCTPNSNIPALCPVLLL